jgi:hypothetical protein
MKQKTQDGNGMSTVRVHGWCFYLHLSILANCSLIGIFPLLPSLVYTETAYHGAKPVCLPEATFTFARQSTRLLKAVKSMAQIR